MFMEENPIMFSWDDLGALELVGQNGGMPSRVSLPAQMPAGAGRFYRAISGRARLQVLRTLLSHPGCAARELVDETSLGMATVRSAIVQLEEIGYLQASAPAGSRRGKNPTYSIDVTLYDLDAAAFLKYLRAS